MAVTRGDLERMLKGPIVMSADDIAAAKREATAKREAAQAVSKARKDKMLRLAEEAKKKAPETETDKLKVRAANCTHRMMCLTAGTGCKRGLL